MSTTTITSQDQREIFDHEFDAPPMTPDTPRISGDEHDRMLEQLVAESREQRMRERRRETEATRIHRRRVRGAVATGTVAIVIAVGGTLFFLEGPSSGTEPTVRELRPERPGSVDRAGPRPERQQHRKHGDRPRPERQPADPERQQHRKHGLQRRPAERRGFAVTQFVTSQLPWWPAWRGPPRASWGARGAYAVVMSQHAVYFRPALDATGMITDTWR